MICEYKFYHDNDSNGFMIASGELFFSFLRYDGVNPQVITTGNYLLSISKSHETVEDSGIGGVLKISDFEMELYDRGGIFRDEIFNGATRVSAKVTLFVGENLHTVFFGDVDLSTIIYTKIYEDSLREEHNVKFSVLSFVKNLDKTPVEDFRSQVNSDGLYTIYDISHTFDRFISLPIFFQEISKFIGIDFGTLTTNVAQTFRKTSVADVNFFDLHLLWAWNLSGSAQPGKLWLKESEDSGLYAYSFVQLADCKSLMMQMCGMFLAYPVYTYDSVSNTVSLNIKQRGQGTVHTSIGDIKSQKESFFLPYDGIRVKYINEGGVTSDLTGGVAAGQYRLPASLSNAQFELLAQKFDFINYLALPGYPEVGVGALGAPDNQIGVWANLSPYTALDAVIDGGNVYESFNQWLSIKFKSYWMPDSPPKMIETTHYGTGIGTVEILDRFTYNGENYTIIDIERDFIKNEMHVKCVKY